jgi:ADP-ribose pyrophosphatase
LSVTSSLANGQGRFHSITGVDASNVRLFIAHLSRIGFPEINEGIKEFVKVTVEELENLITDGQITDGFTIATYVRAKLKGTLL